MIDFSTIVLGPCMEVFARPITVHPIASQPGQPSYGARGIWQSRPVDVQLVESGVLSSQNHSLGVRLAEFAEPVVQGDNVLIEAHLSLPRIGLCKVEDTDDDGQGGCTWTLKVLAP